MKFYTLATAGLLSLSVFAVAHADKVKGTQNSGEMVKTAMTKLMVNKDVAAIDTYFGEPYIQHNQAVPTGLDGLKGLAQQAIAENPAFNYQMIRFIVDGDIGITHGIYEGFGPVPLVAFDVFRVEEGKIVEHWDNLSPVTDKNPSGRTQTDGPVDVADPDLTNANKALVSDFVSQVLIGGAFEKMGAYFDGDNYIQHNSSIGDGLSGLTTGLKTLAEQGITMRIGKLHQVYGEGNFVLTLSEGTVADVPTAFYDLFRVENGKIAEHWDVISPIVSADTAANQNGKF